ncbi:MAG: YjjG family noncanonical pyrimidine nucleotidase [Clostridia bacterium]|nr:YjjG family noncanonical pyrimidine nucleotidase [Clostridia bacterium]
MKYEVILLDADGTLFDFEMAESHALEKLFEYYKFSESYDILTEKYKKINIQLWKDLELGKITSKELKIQRFRRLFSECSLDADFCEVSSAYVNFLSEGTFLLEGAEELCKYLSGKYRLVIITNGIKEVQYARLENSLINRYIQHLIVSEEANSQKPDKGIFEYTFKKIQHTEKNSTLILGDSLSSDIQGGINFGIDTCWYNPGHDPNIKGLPVTYEIHHLLDLKKIL